MSTQIEDSILIDAGAARVYDLAAAVENWPDLLPHYRWVTILRDEGERRLVEMAATRDGFPVRWVSLQWRDPHARTVRYRHVRGVTRGMDVEWTIEPGPGGVRARIVHVFDAPWPRPLGPLIARYVVCDLFVHDIAAKTLLHIKEAAEAERQ